MLNSVIQLSSGSGTGPTNFSVIVNVLENAVDRFARASERVGECERMRECENVSERCDEIDVWLVLNGE